MGGEFRVPSSRFRVVSRRTSGARRTTWNSKLVTRILFDHPIKFLRQIKIFRRQTARVMRGQREGDFVPADIDVGMVPGLLGGARGGIDEPDGGREILEFKSAREGGAAFLPLFHTRQRGFDLCGSQFCHGRFLTDATRRVTSKSAAPRGRTGGTPVLLWLQWRHMVIVLANQGRDALDEGRQLLGVTQNEEAAP